MYVCGVLLRFGILCCFIMYSVVVKSLEIFVNCFEVGKYFYKIS